MPYADPDKRRAYMHAYRQRPNVKARQKAWRKAYQQRPKVKALRKAYNQRPKMKAWTKVYKQQPKAKVQQKAYLQRPKVKARVRAYLRAYHQRWIGFLGRRVILPSNPRIGVCGRCGRKRKRGRQGQRGEKQFAMHHYRYDPRKPLSYTVELCPRCHKWTHDFLANVEKTARALNRAYGVQAMPSLKSLLRELEAADHAT